MRQASLSLSLSLALALVAVACAAASAQASFPGVNGRTAVVLSQPTKAIAYEGYLIELGESPPSGFRFACNWVQNLGDPYGDCYSATDLAVSPDGSELAILIVDHVRPGGRESLAQPSLRILARDGRELRRIPLPPKPAEGSWFYQRPRWSPDGTRFLVALTESVIGGLQSRGVLMLNHDGSDVQILDPQAADPDWSTRGDIVFVRDSDLYVQSPDAAPRRLTWRGASHPTWSPDGRRVAFSRGCGDRAHWRAGPRCGLYVVSAEGGRARLLTRRAIEPVWSPDGREIAFVRVAWSRRYGGFFEPLVGSVDVRTPRRVRYLLEKGLGVPSYDSFSSPEWLPRA